MPLCLIKHGHVVTKKELAPLPFDIARLLLVAQYHTVLKVGDSIYRHGIKNQLGMIQHNAWRPQRGLPERSVSVLRAGVFYSIFFTLIRRIQTNICSRNKQYMTDGVLLRETLKDADLDKYRAGTRWGHSTVDSQALSYICAAMFKLKSWWQCLEVIDLSHLAASNDSTVAAIWALMGQIGCWAISWTAQFSTVVEHEEWQTMNAVLGFSAINSLEDCWEWIGDKDDTFSVKSLKRMLQTDYNIAAIRFKLKWDSEDNLEFSGDIVQQKLTSSITAIENGTKVEKEITDSGQSVTTFKFICHCSGSQVAVDVGFFSVA
ncbi:hypothetical protein M8C21_024983 [Ambrosia artemisiifolia]|uniref:Uncharacterized protein n=1 Tax=Ambrosia artemisiifolia TaxID=4212 RepID=A0AAD5C0U9_AMBAR|nr:hypothetical protein M8C21_024983 [Ambrosia artemisiifolia]